MNTVSSQDAAIAATGGASKEYLTFMLGAEQYGLAIIQVKEIRGYEPVTKIANAPDFIKGVINLRGDIVPIIDLRVKFNVSEATYNEFTIVIMLNVQDRIVGIVVDSVSDVINVTEDEIHPPPEFGVAFDSRYLDGLASVDDGLVILVNIERLITSTEIGIFDSMNQQNEGSV